MTDLRKAAQQALYALELDAYGEPPRYERTEAIAALRAALAKSTGKEGLQVDLVAWADKAMELATDFGVDSLRVGSHERKDSLLNNGVYTFETRMLRDKREKAQDRLRQHLYAGTPQRKPLTEEEIGAAANSVRWSQQYHVDFTRAIERAHGIGSKDE